jgi:hypothetical protein
VWGRLYPDPARGPLIEADVLIYAGLLSDLTPAQLEAACELVTKTHRFPTMPRPADILAQVKNADGEAEKALASEGWDKAWEWFNGSWHPDCGFYGSRHLCDMDPKAEHAFRQAGSFTFLYNADQEQLQWARKRFIEAYLRAGELQARGELLTSGEAKRLLRDITERVALPPAETAAASLNPSSADKTPTPRPAEAMARARPQPGHQQHLTDAEIEERKVFLRKQARELLERQPEGVAA